MTRGTRFEALISLASLTEIKIRANSAFIANATDTEFIIPAAQTVTVDMRMNHIVTRNERFAGGGREMIVNLCKRMLRMNCQDTRMTFIAEIVIGAFETLVSNSDNVLSLIIYDGVNTCLHASQ